MDGIVEGHNKTYHSPVPSLEEKKDPLGFSFPGFLGSLG